MRARRRMFAIVTSALTGAILFAATPAHALDVPIAKDLSSERLPTNTNAALEEAADLFDQLGGNLEEAVDGGTRLSDDLGLTDTDPLAQNADLDKSVQDSMQETSKLTNLVGETAGSVVNGLDDLVGSLD